MIKYIIIAVVGFIIIYTVLAAVCFFWGKCYVFSFSWITQPGKMSTYVKSDRQWDSVAQILSNNKGFSDSLFPTDKNTNNSLFKHSYAEIYDQLLPKYRDRDVSVCEIGVFRGGSIKLWREYFSPNSYIYGVDICDGVPHFEADSHIKIIITDSKSKTRVGKTFQNVMFDIVIDDGDHRPASQLATFEAFWTKLKDGGLYVIEDVTDLKYLPSYKKYGNTQVFNDKSNLNKTYIIVIEKYDPKPSVTYK